MKWQYNQTKQSGRRKGRQIVNFVLNETPVVYTSTFTGIKLQKSLLQNTLELQDDDKNQSER